MPTYSWGPQHFEENFTDGAIGARYNPGNVALAQPFSSSTANVSYYAGPPSGGQSITTGVTDTVRTAKWLWFLFSVNPAGALGVAPALTFLADWTVQDYWDAYWHTQYNDDYDLFVSDWADYGGLDAFRNQVISEFNLDPTTGAGTGTIQIAGTVSAATISFYYLFTTQDTAWGSIFAVGPWTTEPTSSFVAPTGNGLTLRSVDANGQFGQTGAQWLQVRRATGTEILCPMPTDWFRVVLNWSASGTSTLQIRSLADALLAQTTVTGLTGSDLSDAIWEFSHDIEPAGDTRLGPIAFDLTVDDTPYDLITVGTPPPPPPPPPPVLTGGLGSGRRAFYPRRR